MSILVCSPTIRLARKPFSGPTSPRSARSRRNIVPCAVGQNGHHPGSDCPGVFWKAGAKAAAVFTAAAMTSSGAASAITYDQLQNMSYNEVRGTGLAAVCPVIEEGSTNLKDIKPGSYKLRNMCLEPTKIMVKEQGVMKGSGPQWSNTTLLTRQTTNLCEIEADLKVGSDGTVELKESDSYSLNLAPITVQLPGGERVPFLFTIKEVEASGNLTSFGGKIRVPSYRGSTFLDPKGRGGSTGYDTAHALHTRADDEELEKENVKRFDSAAGQVVFSVAKVRIHPTTGFVPDWDRICCMVDASRGEVAGVFELVQPSDTDMGAKVPKQVMVQGLWYGQLG